MCVNCGCSSDSHHHHDQPHRLDPVAAKTVSIEADILGRNNMLAAGNRALFKKCGVFALNLVSSPGSGKTSILERTLRDLQGDCLCAVIEGDQQTDNDAVRIAATGVPAVQINTGAGCHLDAHMVCHALEQFNLERLDLLFVENVGNLVCPAAFDLGERHKVAILSVTEGEDKPLKYAPLFRAAEVMLLNKIDLLPHVDFNVENCREFANWVNPGITIFEVSARTGAGMAAWYEWLKSGVKSSLAGKA